MQVREKNLTQLEAALVELEKKHAQEIDRRIHDTQRGLVEVSRTDVYVAGSACIHSAGHTVGVSWCSILWRSQALALCTMT
jgi:hypothetical protein